MPSVKPVIPPEEIDILSVNAKSPVNIIKTYWFFIPVFFFVFFAFATVIFYKPRIASQEDMTPKPRAVIPDSGMPYLGRVDAPITVIEFANLGCSNCKLLFDPIESGLRKNYIDKGTIKFYQWPMFSADSNVSQVEALYCASDQSKYWQYRDALINSTIVVLSVADYSKIAQQLKLNSTDFMACVNSRKYAPWLEQKNQERLEANLNESNIMVLVNDMFLSSPQLEDISAAIDREVGGMK